MKSYHQLYALSSLTFILSCIMFYIISLVITSLGGGSKELVIILMCAVCYDFLSTIGIEYRARARREKITEQDKTERAFAKLEGKQ